MSSNSSLTKKLIGASLVLLLLDLAGALHWLRSTANWVATPLTVSGDTLVDELKGQHEAWQEREDMLRQNQQLEADILALEQQITELNELRVENQALRDQLELSEVAKQKVTQARVIGRDILGLEHQITINRGSRHGIEDGQAVVISQGIPIGFTEVVYETTSTVRLLTDPELNVPALIQTSRTDGLLRGQSFGQGFRLDFLPVGVEVTQDERVVTSSLSETFPPGLLLGYIFSVRFDSSSGFQQAEVLPAADFERLEYVMVLGE